MKKRIPFDIKYRPEIEAGKYLVVTRDDRPVRVICWDRKGAYPIVGLIKDGRREVVDMFDTDGAYERGEEHRFDLYLVANPDYTEPAAKPSTDSEKDKIVSAIQWTGSNLKEVIDFTGKSPRFDEWFKSWEEFEAYVHSHGDILKLFSEDGSHYEVSVGAWIVKTPDGYNVPSVAKYIQKGRPSVDWDAFRREAAKDFVSAILSNSALVDYPIWEHRIIMIGSGVACADELIKQLKEGKK